MSKANRILSDDNIGKLLIKLSVPAMIAMFVQALYNVVDMIFVGKGVGSLGIAGITLVFPIQMFVMAVGMLIGIGGASIISRSLGAGNQERADKTLANALSIVIVSAILMSAAGYIFIDELLEMFGASKQTLPYAKDYLQIILIGNVFFPLAMTCNNIIRSEGNAAIAMGTMLISAVLNMIMDPIFIFGLDMGIKGAALATVLAQAATIVYLFYYFYSGKSSLNFHFHNIMPDLTIVPEMLAVGSAAFVRMTAASALVAVLNRTLGVYGGDISIAVYGIINRLAMFALMPIFGLAQGLQPIAGFNYGAKRYDKAKKAVFIAARTATIISTAGFFILMLFPQALISIFTNDQVLLREAVYSLRFVVLSFPLVGFQVIGSSIFQAFGKALPAFILSISRQILFLIPLVLILPRFYGLIGVWISFPFADFLAAVITFIFYSNQIKKFDQAIENMNV